MAIGESTAEQNKLPRATVKVLSEGGSKDRAWQLRIWSGMIVSTWFRLLRANRFAVGPVRLGMAVAISLIASINTVLWLVQEAWWGRRISRTELVEDPVFVLGHWRSGTTLLHELLVLDPRHTYLDTYACFAPNHFLISSRLIKWWLRFLLPPRRPMDNMLVSWDAPQEDEWALCNMGLPSPYLWLTFPNRPRPFREYVDLRTLPAAELARWKAGLLKVLKTLTLQSRKRIVLKNPLHTSRLRVLAEMFPKARFVHIVRNPYVVFPSTVRTWMRMSHYHGLQVPRHEGLEEAVYQDFTHMYEVFEEDRKAIDQARVCDVRYEDLVRDPVDQLRSVYEQLDLGNFEPARCAVEEYAARTRSFKTNRYAINPQVRHEIVRRWSTFIDRYGYRGSVDDRSATG